MLKVNNWNNRARCKTIKASEWHQWYFSVVFLLDFEHISYLVTVLLLLTLSMWCQLTGFTANLEMKELSGNLKVHPFLLKNQVIIREFWLNVREIKEEFPRKPFSMINFLFALFSVMYMFMFWSVFLLFLAMSIMLKSGFLCLKI